jgi:hypothetical protein
VPIPIRSSGELVATVECARATSVATQGQSGRRRRAVALASVRRSNCTCRFPAYSFHEDARKQE